MTDETRQILRDIIKIANSDYGDTIQEQVIVYCLHLLGESIYEGNQDELHQQIADDNLRRALAVLNKGDE